MYKTLEEVESVTALGKNEEVIEVFLKSYLQGMEYRRWAEGKDLAETIEVAAVDEEGNETTTVELVNVYSEVDVTEAVTQWKLENYSKLRAPLYPPTSVYMDALVKDDVEAQQQYIEECKAVKARYPKA